MSQVSTRKFELHMKQIFLAGVSLDRLFFLQLALLKNKDYPVQNVT